MRKASPALRRELGWLAGGLVAATVAGLLIGLPTLAAAAYLLGHALWLLWRLDALVAWLKSGAHPATAPSTRGLGDRIVELVHREKKYSRKQKNRYRRALAQFRGLAGELPDATVVLDAQRQIRWSNAAATRILGVQPDRDKGQRIDNLVRAPEFGDFLADGDNGHEAELEIPGGSGRTLAIRNTPAERGMSVLIARDVTQRVRVREMRKAFVGNVSHELRTPLTVIEGYLELLLDRDSDIDPKAREALGHVAEQSTRMRHIVEHLLQLSRLEGNPLDEGEGETVAVAPLLRSVVAEAGGGATVATTPGEPGGGATDGGPSGRRFELDLDDSLALLGSEGEIWSACNNLVTNAVRYGGPACLIRVSWGSDAEGRPVCRVSDDGPGIEARHLPRLSERFYRVDRDRSRDSGGTGLGLAIVKHAAQRHGGQLHVASTPGRGSTFRIEFPANRAVRLRAAAKV